MKHLYKLIWSALVLGMVAGGSLFAQLDTLDVPWSLDGINPLENSLRNTIVGDTLPDGTHPANRVYKLERGGFYWNNDRIEANGFHLRIVGQKGDPGDPVFGNPPTIQMVSNDNGDVDGKMLTGNGDVTLKNLYLIGCDENGVQTYYQPIEVSGSGRNYTFENVIFERTNFSFVAFTNSGNTIKFNDCVFRNVVGRPSTQQWEGRGTSVWIDQDTVIVENCTFFNVGMTALQVEGGAASYTRFNHNTIINLGRSVNTGGWWREAYFTNNLIVNGFWHGEGNADLSNPNRDPEVWASGLFSIADLPSIYGPEEGRRIAFSHNNAFRDPLFAAYYADSIRAQPLMNDVTKRDYINTYDQMVFEDTSFTDPGLNTTFSSAQINLMISNIMDLRAGITPATDYMYEIPQLPGGGDCNVCPSWPLPEDFTYTSTALQSGSTDGLPLGDLNWFPTEKEVFEQNKAQYIADIEAIPGEIIEYIPVDDEDAENGTLAGGATVETFSGFAYVQMQGGGYFEWTFDMAAATTVDLTVETRSNDVQRGQRIIVNGTNIRNDANYGEYYWSDLSTDWQTYLIEQGNLIEGGDALNLPAGTNTIRVEPSWGYQDFSGFEVLTQGTSTVLHTLTTPDITDYAIVELIGEGAPWTPRGFKSVALNGGSVTMPLEAPQNGTYRLTVFYQAPAGTQFVDIAVDGSTVLSGVELTSAVGDSAGGDILTGNFSLTAGTHNVTIGGANNVNIDFAQLVLERVVSGIGDNVTHIDGFELAQNYPNPFNPSTHITYSLGKRAEVSLQVYNLLGQKVRTLVKNHNQVAGLYKIQWDGRDDDGRKVASGVYFYRLKAGDFIRSRKMMLVK
ncbi:MAG TPA: T9SS type A sorting domain-containing protein [Calditrichia bacterium]|nr:T9SS type A sorting domain-containing protein [Calditrichota bacterium]HQU70642.1 T9SS type A sorting domain-containing protein [Calditrichia bacterium]HQV30755.1 T9SS type A sorting domain-containing protein [Calditrichia bacterium]